MSLSSGQASASTSLSQARAATGAQDRAGAPFDIWGEAFFTKARLGNQRANFRIFHVGADYRIGNNLLLGALAEFDDFNDRDDLEAGEAEGSGWLVGPYAMVRLAPELFAEVRAGWGKSNNRVSPLGTYIDEFDTSRSYYSGSLVGQFELGRDTQIRPEVTIRYLDEKQLAYTDSLNVLIPEQSVGQGDISFRPRVHHIIELDSGWTLRPFGEVEGIYTFGTNINNVLDDGLRARIEGGLDALSGRGFRASLGAFHDGIGADNFRSTGIRASISFGF
nr:autotransporter outer membrane beta-barrel domain-containing protein [Pontixanthobacter sp. CEM42]